jgi:ribonucleotide monophosphatase NagD (HAD superfamily)
MEPPKNYLMGMDGVLVTGTNVVPGADKFIGWLKEPG